MDIAKFILIYGSSLCLFAAIVGGLFELALWMLKGWAAYKNPSEMKLDRAGIAVAPDAWIKALAELLKSVATAPTWLALFGAGIAMLYTAKDLLPK